MADGEEDVLELEIESDEDEEQQDENQDANAEETDVEEGDEPTETVIGFDGEEAAPASEGDNSVIRELRKVAREQAKRIAELERGKAPEKIEVGDKPTLESCEYDEERFETALDAWKERKAKAERQTQEQQERAAKDSEAWAERATAYEADKRRLSIAGYEDAEGEVFATLPATTQALIMLTGKPAALVYALSKNPAKLEDLSKLDPARAAMMIGKLEDKLQVTKRAAPNPDRPVRGNAAPASADKELARLEKEAERTGNRTEVIRYKKKLRERA